uniref:Uncharacterized protein AlNc14C96G5862 n=1 Tax=Albugo laibachii Nc14 TaxID=890382 RepID=F0WGY6_9STRA|nr:conserved hypothetical protein [Albugo laibachii Nc14]|eukprot:CCA20501.1 conserved hypothetical protein [Albugo laibachii Nc14]
MSQEKVAKATGWRRVSGEGRQEKVYRRQPYDYAFKLKVINYYATAGISATTLRFFFITDDGPTGSKRKLVLKWKQQRAQIKHHAGTAATSGHQRSRDRGLATTLPQYAETSIVNWVNDFRRDCVPVSSAMLKTRAFEEPEQLNIPLGVFPATWQWQCGFMKRHHFSFRIKTHAGHPADALKQAAAFGNEVSRRVDVEGIKTIYNGDQTAVFFELLPRTTITKTSN